MRIAIAAIGRMKGGPERDLFDRYAGRVKQSGRQVGFDGLDLIELDESRARRPADRKIEEAAALDAALGRDWRRVVLDERGDSISTDDFTSLLRRAQEAGTRGFALVIGGADGLDQTFAAGASARICFGRMTLPHQIVRILAAEQIYRAVTILSGHPYNRV